MPAPRNYYPDAVNASGHGHVLQTDPTGAVSTSALAPSVARAVFLGHAPRALSSATVRWECTAGGGAYSTTWAELALAVGDPVLGGNPTLTVRGYTSIQAHIQSAGAPGAANTTVTATVAEGDGVWAVWATLGGLSPTLRTVAADLMTPGLFAVNTTASWRPSSNVGSAVAWTKAATLQDGPRAVVLIP